MDPNIDLTLLRFEDDIRMWGEEILREVGNIRDLMHYYILTIGQVLNEGKSMMMFFNVVKRVRRGLYTN